MPVLCCPRHPANAAGASQPVTLIAPPAWEIASRSPARISLGILWIEGEVSLLFTLQLAPLADQIGDEHPAHHQRHHLSGTALMQQRMQWHPRRRRHGPQQESAEPARDDPSPQTRIEIIAVAEADNANRLCGGQRGKLAITGAPQIRTKRCDTSGGVGVVPLLPLHLDLSIILADGRNAVEQIVRKPQARNTALR